MCDYKHVDKCQWVLMSVFYLGDTKIAGGGASGEDGRI